MRSRYVRRIAGGPFTTARRSGVNASVGSVRRRLSWLATAAPFSTISLFAGPSVTDTENSTLPRVVPVTRDPRGGGAETDGGRLATCSE